MMTKGNMWILRYVLLGLCVVAVLAATVIWYLAPSDGVMNTVVRIEIKSTLPSWSEWSSKAGVHAGQDNWLIYDEGGVPYRQEIVRSVQFEDGIVVDMVDPALILTVIRQSGFSFQQTGTQEFEAMLLRGEVEQSVDESLGQLLNLLFVFTFLFAFVAGATSLILWLVPNAKSG